MRTVFVAALLCGFAWGQTGVSKVSFEAASVKRAAPEAPGFMSLQGGPGSRDPGRITYTNVNLRALLVRAYDVQDDQISGPSWMFSERYDVVATLPADSTKEQFRLMLQNLLQERFQLALHREKKEFVVYELGLAKGGPKIKTGPDAREVKTTGDGRGPRDGNGFPVPPDHQTAQAAVNGVAMMGANQITMDAFAQFLRFPMGFVRGNTTGRVENETGLPGEYSFTLEYLWPGPAPAGADPGDSAPTIFDAVQQQLGLRLTETKAMLDVLVVDHAEKVPLAD